MYNPFDEHVMAKLESSIHEGLMNMESEACYPDAKEPEIFTINPFHHIVEFNN